MSIEGTRSLKSLQTTRTKLKGWIKQCRTTRDRAAADLIEAEKSLGKVEAEIAAIENGASVVVSEHAMLRYLERFEGVDLSKLSESVQRLAPEMIIKRGNTIVTIIDGEPTPQANERIGE